MRGKNAEKTTDLHSGAMVFDPALFGDDTVERKEYARMARFNSRPRKESRPMYIDTEGRLQYKYSSNTRDPHENRMQAIF